MNVSQQKKDRVHSKGNCVSSVSSNPFRLAIIQPTIAHYRVPLFRALSLNPKLHAIIYTGRNTRDGTLPLTHDDEINYKIIRTFYFVGFVYQWLPRTLFCIPVVVLPFDIRFISNYFILLYRKLTGRKTILWGHGLSNSPRMSFIKLIRKQLARTADAIIFYDESRLRIFRDELGITDEKLFVAPNTIDLESIKKLIEKIPSQTRTQILYIGRLIPEKKVDQLLEAFAMITDKLPKSIGVTIIGDGPEFTRLVTLAETLGITNRTEFTGEITNQEMLAAYFMRSLIMVSPGYIGLAAVHALAYGVPVLLPEGEPHSPEVAVVTNGSTGIKYGEATATALAEALILSLKDPENLRRLGKQGQREIFENYGIDRMVTGFEAAYNYVLGLS